MLKIIEETTQALIEEKIKKQCIENAVFFESIDIHVTSPYILDQAKIYQRMHDDFNWEEEDVPNKISVLGKYFADLVDMKHHIPSYSEFVDYVNILDHGVLEGGNGFNYVEWFYHNQMKAINEMKTK